MEINKKENKEGTICDFLHKIVDEISTMNPGMYEKSLEDKVSALLNNEVNQVETSDALAYICEMVSFAQTVASSKAKINAYFSSATIAMSLERGILDNARKSIVAYCSDQRGYANHVDAESCVEEIFTRLKALAEARSTYLSSCFNLMFMYVSKFSPQNVAKTHSTIMGGSNYYAVPAFHVLSTEYSSFLFEMSRATKSYAITLSQL